MFRFNVEYFLKKLNLVMYEILKTETYFNNKYGPVPANGCRQQSCRLLATNTTTTDSGL